MVGFHLVSVLLASSICASVAFPQLKPNESESSGLEVVPQEDEWSELFSQTSSNEIVDADLGSASVKFPGFPFPSWFGPPQSPEETNWMMPPPGWWFGGGGGFGLGWGGFRPRPSRPTTIRPVDSDEDSNSDSQEIRKKRDDSDENSNQSDSNESNDSGSDSKESRKKKDDSKSVETNSDSQSDENHSLDSDSDSWERWG